MLFRINIGLTLFIDVHWYVVNFIMVISVGFANLDLIHVLHAWCTSALVLSCAWFSFTLGQACFGVA